ncbi:MAG: hypothetical protein OQK25_07845 [Gammaproteobacteria bacterium]|nr:hypothetical protein [Gammaproteobacteria bacterium]
MNSDNVNSISDTVESLQIAQIIRSTFYELHGNRNWPNTRELLQLDSSGTLSRPTHMKLPSAVKELESAEIKYNKQKPDETRNRYEDVHYMYPDEFLDMVNRRDNTKDNVDTILDLNDVELQIFTDRHPEYFTSFDDEYLVFDSYNIEVDSTLQNSKTQMIAYSVPSWSMVDTFVPDLPIDAFPLLLAESKSRCFVAIKEMANEKVEQSAQKQGRWMARKAWRTKGGVRYPDYGRKGPNRTKSWKFDRY